MSYVIDKLKKLKELESDLLEASSLEKNNALKEVAIAIENNRDDIKRANQKDINIGKENNMNSALLDRLMLDDERIDGIIEGINTVIDLQDPIWKSEKVWTLENQITISRISFPLRVIGIIYESRPNVTVDAFSLAFKSGNGIVLRGSSSAINSNIALVQAIKEGLRKTDISEEVIQFFEDTDRKHVMSLLTAKGYVDLVIPRGGKGLIDLVLENAKVPTLQTGEGNCHVYVDESGNLDEAIKIVENAKLQRVGVCNACETLLVHENIAEDLLPRIYEMLNNKAEMVGSERVREIIEIERATEEDYGTEFLDYKIAIEIVKDVDEAIKHINKYGTKHSESIVTESYTNVQKFTKMVDASTVYVNASTRFTDGGVFGFGAEMGISTQKTHARGPVGLEQLVTHKYVVLGSGQIRK